MALKRLTRFLCTASVIVIFFTVSSLFFYRFSLPMAYGDFYSNATSHFKVPGLSEGFVPQGLDYVSHLDKFLISGYEGIDEKSVVYIGGKGGFEKVELTCDGGDFFCHTGGICAWGEYAYIAGCDGYCYVLALKDLFHENGRAKVIGKFRAGNNADFISAFDGKLYIGEYYCPIVFPTAENHHMTTPCSDRHYAIMTSFSLKDNAPLGVDPIPKEAYSIRDSVQGISLTDDGKIIMSSSNSVTGAFLTTYTFSSFTPSQDIMKILGYEVPLYYLDSSVKTASVEILPNSEGIVCVDNRIYMVFEASSFKFSYGRWLNSGYIYSLNLAQVDAC